MTSSNEYVKDYSIIGVNHCIYTNSHLNVRTLDQLNSISLFESFMSGNAKNAWIGDNAAVAALYDGKGIKGASLSYIMKYVDVYTGKLLGVLIIEIDPKVIAGMVERMSAGLGDCHIISQEGFDNAFLTLDDTFDPAAQYAFSGEEYYQNFNEGDEEVKVINERHEIIILGRAENNAIVIGNCHTAEDAQCRSKPHTRHHPDCYGRCRIDLRTYRTDDLQQPEHRREKIVSAAKTAASGDLRQKLSSDRKDEFGILINSIGQMMDSMRDLIIEAAGIANSVIESASMVSSSTQRLLVLQRALQRNRSDFLRSRCPGRRYRGRSYKDQRTGFQH